MNTPLGPDPTDLDELWDEFLTRWPLESLDAMTLSDYASAGSQDAFVYWLEGRTEKLGSIWGGSSFKFGIFSRRNTTEQSGNPKYIYGPEYAWRSNAGATADEAFQRVKSAIIRIATSARDGRLEEIDDDVLWPIVVWKIAFLYQDRDHLSILPVYKKSWLGAFLGDDGRGLNIPELQRRIMAKRGNVGLFNFASEVSEKSKELLGKTALTQEAALEFLDKRFTSARTPNDVMAGFLTDDGRPLALDRRTDPVGIYLEPCEPKIVGVTTTNTYAADGARHSSLAAHAPKLGEGHSAIKATVATMEALEKLADFYDTGPSRRTADSVVLVPTPVLSSERQPLNQILFGPPGTGKTYATIDKTLAILDPGFLGQFVADRKMLKARFDELSRLGHVKFVTFHQSFAYEDFVEGIRAETDEDGQIRYYVADGVFKALCAPALSKTAVRANAPIDFSDRRIWKMSLGAAETEAHVFEQCIRDNIALLGWGSSIDFSGCENAKSVLERFHSQGRGDAKPTDYDVRSINIFKNRIAVGDLLIVSDGNEKFRAIGQVTGEYWHLAKDDDEYVQGRDVRWLRTYTPSLPYSELMDKRFSQMTLYELRNNTISRDRLRSLLAEDAGRFDSAPNAQSFSIGDSLGNGYSVFEVTPEILWLRKPIGSELPLSFRILEQLADLVAEGKITISDINDKKVFDKVPDLKLEKYLVNGYAGVVSAVVERLSAKARAPSQHSGRSTPSSRVLIIDEINRGNVSRVFGELITLIEPTKRIGASEALSVTLPYSKEEFGVPENVFIIGTMNTADRSLASIDIALRRRFNFIDMPPKPEMLSMVVVDGANVGEVLATMNSRIGTLLDRDHQLGHAYFLELEDSPTLAVLASIFRRQIIPLLQEYFFEDWGRIRLVLNDHRKAAENAFIVASSQSSAALFGEDFVAPAGEGAWELNPSAFERIEAYRGIVRVNE